MEVETVYNPDYKMGMLSSIQAGLRALPANSEAVMVLLGDQPMVGSEVMDRVIDKFKLTGKGIIVATHQGKRGHPLLFSSRYFREVLEYSMDGSLRDLLEYHPADVEEVETGRPEILRDIDTEKEYRQELKHFRS
jgi:molybdenum cofactor cytidylyltransferase